EVEVQQGGLRDAQQRHEGVLPADRPVPVPFHGGLDLQRGGPVDAVGQPPQQLQPEAQVGGLVEQDCHAPSVTRLWYAPPSRCADCVPLRCPRSPACSTSSPGSGSASGRSPSSASSRRSTRCATPPRARLSAAGPGSASSPIWAGTPGSSTCCASSPSRRF